MMSAPSRQRAKPVWSAAPLADNAVSFRETLLLTWEPTIRMARWSPCHALRQKNIDVLFDALATADEDRFEAMGPPRASYLAPPLLRHSLAVRAGVSEYVCQSPLDVRKVDRSPRWEALAALVSAWPRLSTARRCYLVSLLGSLTFYELIVRLVDELPEEPESSIEEHYVYEVARMVQRIDIHYALPPRLFSGLLSSASSWAIQVACATQLLVRGSRYERNETQAEDAFRHGLRLLENRTAQQDEKTWLLMASRFWRAAALFAAVFGRTGAIDAHARHALEANAELATLAAGPVWRQLVDEDLFLLLGAVVKAGCRRRDDSADEAAHRLLRMNGSDPYSLYDVAQLWQARGRPYEAALLNLQAARMGTTQGAVAAWSAGTCFEDLDDVRGAIDAYRLALEIDDRLLSAREGLARCWKRLRGTEAPL